MSLAKVNIHSAPPPVRGETGDLPLLLARMRAVIVLVLWRPGLPAIGLAAGKDCSHPFVIGMAGFVLVDKASRLHALARELPSQTLRG